MILFYWYNGSREKRLKSYENTDVQHAQYTTWLERRGKSRVTASVEEAAKAGKF